MQDDKNDVAIGKHTGPYTGCIAIGKNAGADPRSAGEGTVAIGNDVSAFVDGEIAIGTKDKVLRILPDGIVTINGNMIGKASPEQATEVLNVVQEAFRGFYERSVKEG